MVGVLDRRQRQRCGSESVAARTMQGGGGATTIAALKSTSGLGGGARGRRVRGRKELGMAREMFREGRERSGEGKSWVWRSRGRERDMFGEGREGEVWSGKRICDAEEGERNRRL
ncbi:unnamed protein product [Linum trigynum]|uniref:Uncharacterized protein n=1 Tax=Linum trigynum TaxID=586398 RepID=A0AAV2EMN2_9ROSI